MKVKLGIQNIFILCSILLIVVSTSCHNQRQINKQNQIVLTKSSIQPSANGNNFTRLKYTSGVRSILEDSKGNIWFGSYNEGACLLYNGELQYFTTENGL